MSKNIFRRDFIKGTAVVSTGAAFSLGIRPIFGSDTEAQERTDGWFDTIYRQLHIDYEIGNYKEIFKNFDAEASAQIFEEAGFQTVCYFAKGGSGYSYYPTEIGVVHPGLKIDFVGEMTKALKKRGIKCIIYVLPGSERRLHKIHPDWIFKREGQSPSSSEEEAFMCLKSPYMEEVGIPQMKEIVSRYDPDGIFIDIMIHDVLHNVCHCNNCKELFNKDIGGEIPKDDNDPRAFAYRKWTNRHFDTSIDKVYNALAEIKPEIIIINNYAWTFRYPVTPPPYIVQLNWDPPPPPHGMYSLNISVEAHYLPTLPNMMWACHNTRGNSWGDYSLRDPKSFTQECAIMLAGCGRTLLSDDAYPSGKPDPAVYELFGEINNRTKNLEPYVKGCSPVSDTAILHSADSIWSKAPMKPSPTWKAGPAYYSVIGAHKALIEGHVQMNVVNSDTLVESIADYGALILADQRILNERECSAIRNFVQNGGSLIATFETGTRDINNNPLDDFSLSDILGVRYVETSDTRRCFLRMESKIEKYGIPAMDIQAGRKYARIKNTTAQTLVEMVPPYENRSAPSEITDGPGITINSYGKGKAIYCAAQLFHSYYRESTSVFRKIADWMLDLAYPVKSRSIALENTPINVELFYNQRGRERFIHLVNSSSDKREVGLPVMQDFTTVHGIKIKARVNSKPVKIIIVPDERNIDFKYRNGWIEFEAEPLEIHSVYKIAT